MFVIQIVSITLTWIFSVCILVHCTKKPPKANPKQKQKVLDKTTKTNGTDKKIALKSDRTPTADDLQVQQPKLTVEKKPVKKEEPKKEKQKTVVESKTEDKKEKKTKQTVEQLKPNDGIETVTNKTEGFERVYKLDRTLRDGIYSPATNGLVLRHRMDNYHNQLLLDPRKVVYKGNIDVECFEKDPNFLYNQISKDIDTKAETEPSDKPASVHRTDKKTLVFTEKSCKLYEIIDLEEEEEEDEGDEREEEESTKKK